MLYSCAAQYHGSDMPCKFHHRFNYCGVLVAVFVLFSINVLVAEAAYSFQVSINGFKQLDNGSNDTAQCSNCLRFGSFCLREFGHSHNNTDNCSLGTQTNDTGVGLGDSVTINSTEPWPGSFQIYFQVLCDDNVTGDVFADSVLSTSTDFVGPMNFTSENGNFTVDLSFRVSCQVDYYGPNCTVFCQGRDDTMGHYHCNETTGDIVCLSGYQNTTRNCTEPICQTGCHQVGGYCDSPGECRCNAGWNGTLCDQCIPAEHCSPIGGYCTVPGECNCRGGFHGESCNNMEDSHPHSLIGGVVAAGVVMVALCAASVLLLCWIVRRRKQLKHVALMRKETLKVYQSGTLTKPLQLYPRKTEIFQAEQIPADRGKPVVTFVHLPHPPTDQTNEPTAVKEQNDYGRVSVV